MRLRGLRQPLFQRRQNPVADFGKYECTGKSRDQRRNGNGDEAEPEWDTGYHPQHQTDKDTAEQTVLSRVYPDIFNEVAERIRYDSNADTDHYIQDTKPGKQVGDTDTQDDPRNVFTVEKRNDREHLADPDLYRHRTDGVYHGQCNIDCRKQGIINKRSVFDNINLLSFLYREFANL